MAKVQFRLRSKAKQNVSIQIRFSIKRNNVLETNTEFSIKRKDWSFASTPTKEDPKKKSTTRGVPKQNDETNSKLHNDLKELETFVLKQYTSDVGNGITIDKDWLKSKINECFGRDEKTETGLVLNHIQYIIDNAATRKVKGRKELGLSVNRIKGYVSFKNLFEIYQKKIKKQVNFLDVNKPFVEKFKNWLIKTKGYSMNYAGKQIDNLKTVCLDAATLDIPVNHYVNKISSFSENDKDRYIQTLSFDELEQIRNANITTPELINARSWLLLGCEIGQRVGDLMSITDNNIRYVNDIIFLDIIQQKTDKEVTIPITAPHIIDIIENDMPHKISIQKLNDYIKRVCKVAEIDEVVRGTKLNPETRRKELNFYHKYELITSHCFRRSFATNYYKKIPTPILINITGHSKESLFLTYINKREDKDANAELFMKYYKDVHKPKTSKLRVVKRAE